MVIRGRDLRLRLTVHGGLALVGVVLLSVAIFSALVMMPGGGAQSAGNAAEVPGAALSSRAGPTPMPRAMSAEEMSGSVAAAPAAPPGPKVSPVSFPSKLRKSRHALQDPAKDLSNPLDRPARGKAASPRTEERATARLAIVIDDIGHRVDILEKFLDLQAPLTFSILPAVPHARASARAIESAGMEYLIHMPMQPFDYPAKNPGPLPLLLAQSPGETERRVLQYLKNLPGASGASNHMGSAYTSNREHMRVVQNLLAENNLFFLNSRTSGTVIPERIAQGQGYSYLERDVFLDHDPSEASVDDYFQRAVRIARARGSAIAIGHPYPTTLRVLQRHLPRLDERDVELVPLSTLLP